MSGLGSQGVMVRESGLGSPGKYIKYCTQA